MLVAVILAGQVFAPGAWSGERVLCYAGPGHIVIESAIRPCTLGHDEPAGVAAERVSAAVVGVPCIDIPFGSSDSVLAARLRPARAMVWPALTPPPLPLPAPAPTAGLASGSARCPRLADSQRLARLRSTILLV
jgi:hypothetical protein